MPLVLYCIYTLIRFILEEHIILKELPEGTYNSETAFIVKFHEDIKFKRHMKYKKILKNLTHIYSS